MDNRTLLGLLFWVLVAVGGAKARTTVPPQRTISPPGSPSTERCQPRWHKSYNFTGNKAYRVPFVVTLEICKGICEGNRRCKGVNFDNGQSQGCSLILSPVVDLRGRQGVDSYSVSRCGEVIYTIENVQTHHHSHFRYSSPLSIHMNDSALSGLMLKAKQLSNVFNYETVTEDTGMRITAINHIREDATTGTVWAPLMRDEEAGGGYCRLPRNLDLGSHRIHQGVQVVMNYTTSDILQKLPACFPTESEQSGSGSPKEPSTPRTCPAVYRFSGKIGSPAYAHSALRRFCECHKTCTNSKGCNAYSYDPSAQSPCSTISTSPTSVESKPNGELVEIVRCDEIMFTVEASLEGYQPHFERNYHIATNGNVPLIEIMRSLSTGGFNFKFESKTFGNLGEYIAEINGVSENPADEVFWATIIRRPDGQMCLSSQGVSSYVPIPGDNPMQSLRKYSVFDELPPCDGPSVSHDIKETPQQPVPAMIPDHEVLLTIENTLSSPRFQMTVPLTLKRGQNVYDGMVNAAKVHLNFRFESKNFGDLGEMIMSINGVESDPDKETFWAFVQTCPETCSMPVGVSSYFPEPYEELMLTYQTYDFLGSIERCDGKEGHN